jgi:O-antigen/teichoic acid export membrane protein
VNAKKSLAENIFKGSLTVIIFASITSPIGYLIKMVYSRSLSTEMFGLFYSIYAFYILLSSFTDLGFSYSLVYLTPKYLKKKDFKTCWNLYKYNQIINLITSSTISIITIVFADWLSKYIFKVPEAKTLIYIFAIFLISGSLLSTIDKLFMGMQQEKYYSTSQPVRLIFSLTFSLFLWLVGNGNIIYYAAGWSVASVIVVIIYSIILKKENGRLVSRLTIDKQLFTLMANYALPSFLTSSIIAVISSVDIVILTILKGVGEVGIYAIVFPLATISSVVLTPINTYILPLISHLMEGEKIKVEKLLEYTILIIPLIAVYFGLFILLFPSQPINILFGSKWIDSAKIPLMILAIGYIGAQLSNILATFSYGLGYVKERLAVSLIIVVINILLSYILITKYSVLGIAISGSIIFVISTILNTIVVRKSLPFKFPLMIYLKMFIFSLLISIPVLHFKLVPQGLYQYLIYGGIYSIIFFLFASSLKLFNKKLLLSILK